MFGKRSRILVAAFGLLLGLLTIAATGFAASKEKVLYSFCVSALCPDGAYPAARLISDATGNLYGTTYFHGNSNCILGCGTVFELRRVNGKWKQKVLHHFEHNGNDGYYPAAGLIFDAAGNLYGTTAGPYGGGTVFELMPEKNGKWKEKILHSFSDNSEDGYDPEAALVLGADGKLYGTTRWGGANDSGTVFELAPSKNGDWNERVLHSFNSVGTDGFSPMASLTLDSSGNIYGTTLWGGTTRTGIVFELTPGKDGTWTESVLYNFCSLTDCADGAAPAGGLVLDASGSLYGTASGGGDETGECGQDGCGTVFKLTPGGEGTWSLTTLHTFEYTDGAFPIDDLIFDTAGNLYGVTIEGGAYNSSQCDSLGYSGCGTVFELAPGTGGNWTETVLHSFNSNGVDGYTPYGGVIMDAAGNLYGTTYAGGTNNYGTVFEVRP